MMRALTICSVSTSLRRRMVLPGRTTTATNVAIMTLPSTRQAPPQRRHMSMFLWRHLPIYRKEPGTNNWRLNKYQKKPAKPVRVEGVRPSTEKYDRPNVKFTLAVLLPNGQVKPFKGKHGVDFIDFWREWTERWRLQELYQKIRGIPHTRYCPRCDEPMRWVGRQPAQVLYVPVQAKRRLFEKVRIKDEEDTYNDDDDGFSVKLGPTSITRTTADTNDTATARLGTVDGQAGAQLLSRNTAQYDASAVAVYGGYSNLSLGSSITRTTADTNDTATDNATSTADPPLSTDPATGGFEDDGKSPRMQDIYCCPYDECGIRKARIEFSRNTIEVHIIEGLTDKQWHPGRYGGGKGRRRKSIKAKEALAETPFYNRGWSIERTPLHKAPFGNNVTHEQAQELVYQDSLARYNNPAKRVNFHRTPDWYTLRNRFAPASNVKINKFNGDKTPCNQCGTLEDSEHSVCFNCGQVLCPSCRDKAFPKHKQGYFAWGCCPGCRKSVNKSLNQPITRKGHNALISIIKQYPRDSRKAQWLLALGDSILSSKTPFKYKQKAREFLLQAGNLGKAKAYTRLGDFYLLHYEPEADLKKAYKYYKKAEALKEAESPSSSEEKDQGSSEKKSDEMLS